MNQLDLLQILASHAVWRCGYPGGSRADLTGATLARATLAGANLTGANLTEANLTWANLTGANLAGANLTGATLAGADLTGADLTVANLTGANGLPEAPAIPHIDAAILGQINGHKLNMSTWRSECGTAYCLGGFAILLAGEAGAELERKTSTYLAARLIYEASRPGLPCPNFFASNETAMADLRAGAERDPL